jgi:hypothetical protein
MEAVSEALRERLGVRAANDLEAYAEDVGHRWRDDVLQTASERCDNRLAAATDRFDNRLALATQSFENRLSLEIGALRLEMQKGFSDLRVEVLRWSFLFWIGQLAAVAGLLSFMLSKGLR